MDEVVLRRVVGVITLAIAAFLLSWLLPRPGLERLRGEGERVVTVDLTRPDATPQELPPPSENPPEPPQHDVAPPPREPATPVAVPEPPAPSKPAEPPEPAEQTKPAEPKPAEAKPAEPKPPEPKPAVPKPVEPKPSKPAPAAPSSATGQVMVQAGAYSHLDKAEGVRERATAQGHRCVISPAETPKGTLYRLRCGPYADKAQAQAAVKSLTAAGIAAQIVGGGR